VISKKKKKSKRGDDALLEQVYLFALDRQAFVLDDLVGGPSLARPSFFVFGIGVHHSSIVLSRCFKNSSVDETFLFNYFSYLAFPSRSSRRRCLAFFAFS